ncbi:MULTISPECIES: hypothetical protein [unclassified Streptomyces]|uniref:hypothetical protein n=1 Tax=unclassified Streptomyces TaxID=2593676 RepID=UPI00332E0204
MKFDTFAVNVTPAGIPVVGVVVMAGLLGFFVWDSLRLPGGLWFRWLLPLGFIPAMTGGLLNSLPLILIGALVMGVGFGFGKKWRWDNTRRGF